MKLPLLAITMGDPAGVGPETIAGAWERIVTSGRCRPVVLGHPEVLRRAVKLLGRPIEVAEVSRPEIALPSPALLPCWKCVADDAAEVPPARIDARGGQAAFDALVAAAKLALAGEVDAIVTAPLHKAALWQAGHHYPGHTELLAELCGVSDFAMMLYLAQGGPIQGRVGLGVVHTTLHTSLRSVFEQLTAMAILEKIRLAHRTFAPLLFAAGIHDKPRVGVAALNPHAGEEGLFGNEETEIILPAVEAARAEGIQAVGPLPCDTLMVRAAAGDFDTVVAMYHDQGHIALKLLGMHRAVNITLGLPIVRTSVAHGTAFDLAWQGKAETSSMIEAVRIAADLAAMRVSRH